MFTGLIQDTGTLVTLTRRSGGALATIRTALPAHEFAVGESIAVDGACLTVTRAARGHFQAGVSPETLARTTLGRLPPGTPVHLERAVAVGDRMGGHFVLGHVDATGTVVTVTRRGEFTVLAIEAPAEVLQLTAPKGSIAVDGVSLTVNTVAPPRFDVMIVPHTLAHTKFGRLRPGTAVNLEADVTARYQAQSPATPPGESAPGVTLETLRKAGYI